jgi:hypothetical protein
MKIVEMGTGISKNLSAGKTYYCPDDDVSKPCQVVVCKKNAALQTGFECLAYLPLNKAEGEKATADYKNDYIEKLIQEKLVLLNKNDKTPMAEFCNKDNVVCYYDKKMFPEYKVASSKVYSKISYKNRFDIAGKNSIKLDITVYEVK